MASLSHEYEALLTTFESCSSYGINRRHFEELLCFETVSSSLLENAASFFGLDGEVTAAAKASVMWWKPAGEDAGLLRCKDGRVDEEGDNGAAAKGVDDEEEEEKEDDAEE